MITFFRKIRVQLIGEGNTRKYLFYAIGEIALVMIGILLALQVNNWNTQQLKIVNEEIQLSSLAKELSNNITRIDSSLELNKKYYTSLIELDKKLNADAESITNEEISSSLNYFSIDINASVLEDIIVKNSEVLITQKTLIQDFRNLANNYKAVTKSVYYLDEFWNDKVTDFYITTGISIGIKRDINAEEIYLKDMETSGYSRKQLMALLYIKRSLQLVWQEELEQALVTSHKVLNKLEQYK